MTLALEAVVADIPHMPISQATIRPTANVPRAGQGQEATEAQGMAPAAGTEALKDPSEHHGDPTALGLDATAWVSLAMLVVIAIMIWKKVPAAINRALDTKIAGIRAQLKEASELRAEAEALRNEYAAKTQAVEGDLRAMRERGEAEAAAIVAKARADTEALVERRTRLAEDKIAAAERSAIADIRATAANAAATAAAQLIAERHDAVADKVMTDRAIAGLGRLN